MKAVFLHDARIEMLDAAKFYKTRQAGLGDQYLDAIDRAVDNVEQFPRRWPLIGKGVRRRLVGRFPYGILYRVSRREIAIVAIMHLSRRPGYWGYRLRSSRPGE